MHEAQQLVANEGLHDIVRKPRIVMRDPQQQHLAGPITQIELPVFHQSRHDAEAEARSIVDQARTTAQQMLEQARAARDGEVEAAQRQGYAAGHAEGLDAADRECAALVATAEQIAARVATEREHLLAQAEGEIVDLAIAIARRLVNAAIEVEPDLVVDVCRGAMRKAFQRETLVVLAHPDDLQMLRRAGPAMASELGGIHQLDFVEERRLQCGSVVVRTPAGEIDATFEGKATKIEEGLRELVDARRAEARTQQRRAA